jgi:hypothetical protein
MKKMIRLPLAAIVAVSCFSMPVRASSDEPLQSPRMERAKDLIADEQWQRAIEELRGAAADKKEKHRDEALFWLAHSQNQVRDLMGAMKTITELQSTFPKSPWVKPATSLRIEIAQQLNRTDVLWNIVRPGVNVYRLDPPPTPQPAAAPPAPMPPSGEPPRAVPPPRPDTPRVLPPPMGVPPPTPTPAMTPPRPVAPAGAARPAQPVPDPSPTPFAATVWMPEGWTPDAGHRIQALSSLIQTDAQKVIPILMEIALESPDANEARRAVFVLAQSGKPEAYTSVLEVARRGSETVQIAAVRELGRFGGRDVAEQLVQVYRVVSPRVKYQVVDSLGERSATTALLGIAEREVDKRLKETAIVRLGQAGAREQLQRYYLRARDDLKEPIIRALVLAKAEDELIRIAQTETDESIQRQALTGLRLLGTAKARAFLEKREIEKRRQNR